MEQQTQEFLTPDEFRRAKAEHYLEHAQACIGMSRFKAAKDAIRKVAELLPESDMHRELDRIVSERLERLAHHNNGNGQALQGRALQRERAATVLLVDQDERVLTSLSHSLQREGVETVGASSLEEALDALAAVQPDVIVSEVNFESGPEGLELFQRIRSNGALSTTSFIFLAARLDHDILVAGKRFGVDDFIAKPADDDLVVASIRNCIVRRRSLPTAP
jgi:PleD family two-component response regulator